MAYYFSDSNLCPPSPTYTSSASPASSASSSPNPFMNDCENFPMPEEQSRVKSLLNMFPPPITAKDYVLNNSFSGTDGHVKRPSNCFMIFRKIAHDQKIQNPNLKHYNEREFSKIIASIWKDLDSVEMSFYKSLSQDISKIHKRDFPEYKYKPKRDKAAWKHYNPEEDNKSKKRKPKPKHSQKEQPKNNIFNTCPRTPEPDATQAHVTIPKLSLNLNTQPTILSTDMGFDFSQNQITPITPVTPILSDGLAISPNGLEISSDISPDISSDITTDFFYYLWDDQYLYQK